MKWFTLFLVLTSNSLFAADPAFDRALAGYEKLHQAFFDRDLSKVHESAKGVLKQIEDIKDEKMIKTLTYTKKKLESLVNVDTLEKGQADFNTISQGLLVVLEKESPNNNYSRYYCPMVKKYWIQNIKESEKVMNPYASDSMPHCGEKK